MAERDDLIEEVQGLRRELEGLRGRARRALLSRMVAGLDEVEGPVDVRGPLSCPEEGRCNLCGKAIAKGEGCYLAIVGKGEECRAYAFHRGCVDDMKPPVQD